MRLQTAPGVNFWYEVSIIGLFLLPLLFYNFIYNFIGYKGYFLRVLWTICTLAIDLSIHFHLFLKHPQVVDLGNGQASFVYDIAWPVIFPMIFSVLVIASIIAMIVGDVKKNESPEIQALREIVSGYLLSKKSIESLVFTTNTTAFIT